MLALQLGNNTGDSIGAVRDTVNSTRYIAQNVHVRIHWDPNPAVTICDRRTNGTSLPDLRYATSDEINPTP